MNIEGGKAEAEQLVGVLGVHRADVLMVQEVTPEAASQLEKAGLSDVMAYGVVDAQPGHSGTGIWSRWPLRAVPPVPGLVCAAPRAVLTVGGRPVTLTAVHVMAPLNHRERRWRHELGLLTARAGAAGGPEVVAGDFNASRDHRPFRDLVAAGYLDTADAAGRRPWPALTWPSGPQRLPVMRLDHVLVSRGDFAVTEARIVLVPGTDHRGVLAVVRLRDRSESRSGSVRLIPPTRAG